MSFGMIMKNQISWKCEIVLYGYRHCIHKNRYYKDVAEDVGTKFDTSSYELDRPLPKTKKKKSNWINKRWIRWKKYDKFVEIRAKTLFKRWWYWR